MDVDVDFSSDSSTPSSPSVMEMSLNFNFQDELNEKNSARKKFGLDPIGVEEFKKLQGDVDRRASDFQKKLQQVRKKSNFQVTATH